MIQLSNDATIYIYSDAVDMRKSIDGLSILVAEALEQSPQSGSIYLFCNKSRNKVKLLYWDKNGFILHYKRLEKGRFKLRKMPATDVIEIDKEQLTWLLAGLDFMLIRQHQDMNFSHYF